MGKNGWLASKADDPRYDRLKADVAALRERVGPPQEPFGSKTALGAFVGSGSLNISVDDSQLKEMNDALIIAFDNGLLSVQTFLEEIEFDIEEITKYYDPITATTNYSITGTAVPSKHGKKQRAKTK